MDCFYPLGKFCWMTGSNMLYPKGREKHIVVGRERGNERKERKRKVQKSLQATGKAHGVVEQGVCQEQLELGSGNRTRLAVLVWGPRGGGAVQAMGVQRVCWPSEAQPVVQDKEP